MVRPSWRLVALLVLAVGAQAFAQSPNNSAIVVVVVDQTGAVVPDAGIRVVNSATGISRDAVSGAEGSAVFPALPLDGAYTVSVTRAGFQAEDVTGLTLRASESSTVRVRLVVSGGSSEVTVYGSGQGVRGNAQVARSFDGTAVEEAPILGRKVGSIPLLESAFRSGKGTGDLFVNATYFITGAGSRRTTTYMLDGASNDEVWGRQTMVATVPIGAIEEVSALTSAFSVEYGWTAGPALNIVTRSGTNDVRGELLYLSRPGGTQARNFGTAGFCPPSVSTCGVPSTLERIKPADVPDSLSQYSLSFGAPLRKDRTFVFLTGDYTRQDRTTLLSPSLPAFVLDDGRLHYVGHYRQKLFNGRLDHAISPNQTLMFRTNVDTFFDTNPNDAVVGTSAPTVARRFTRSSITGQGNHTAVISATLLNEVRVSYSDNDPVIRWEAQNLSTTYARSGSFPFRIGESRQSDIYSRQLQVQDTLTWSRGRHTLRLGTSLAHHRSGGVGSEPGQATLGTFTFLSTTSAPFDQLTLSDVQNYSQPIAYGPIDYDVSQWLVAGFVQDAYRAGDQLTIDVGLRYDRQTLTDATRDFAPRLGVAWHPNGSARTTIRGGYGLYYTQMLIKQIAKGLTGDLEGLASYTAAPGQMGFPTCLTGACLPVNLDPLTLPLSQRPARDVTLIAGDRAKYEAQFARFGIDFSKVAGAYPDTLVNPKSQVLSIGVEREVAAGLFVGADYVHQHWGDLDSIVDLNAPAPFDRTEVGQTRTVAVANATRPIAPAAGGVRQVNVLMNLGEADYDGLQTQIRYRGHRRLQASLSYTLSKATNTTEPDGNGVAPSEGHISRLGEQERGPSVVDQRHRAVIAVSYRLPHEVTVGTVTQLASARPLNAVTGVDNNGDGANNDRPVVDGRVLSKSAFRGTGTQDVTVFLEGRMRVGGGHALQLRLEGFNLFNHANILGRAQQTYGNTITVNPTFGQVAAAGANPEALPSLANIDPPRMLQVRARFFF